MHHNYRSPGCRHKLHSYFIIFNSVKHFIYILKSMCTTTDTIKKKTHMHAITSDRVTHYPTRTHPMVQFLLLWLRLLLCALSTNFELDEDDITLFHRPGTTGQCKSTEGFRG